MENKFQVVIVGGGPGGFTAGLYASRAGLKTLLLEKNMFGGQIVNSSLLENYPGFPDGISGFELMDLMKKQAEKYGLVTKLSEATALKPGKIHEVTTSDGSIKADVVIIASGAYYTTLGLENEKRLIGKGVSYCATCDGFFFRNKDVAVIGGGDTAITDALELAQHAAKVFIVHRRNQLRAGEIMQKRAFEQPKIEMVWDSVVDDIVGEEAVTALKLKNVKTGGISELPINGVFVAIGSNPNSKNFKGSVAMDESGFIVVDHTLATSVPGIYAVGDVRKYSSRQVSTAVGDGAAAAMNAFKYIQENQ